MDSSDKRPYVFISYAHANSNIVLPTLKAMKNSNINIWYDDGIVAGSEWPEFIAEKVVSCTKFVLFVSEAYLRSQNCKRELNFAISKKKDILSIFIENVNLSPGMEMQLGTYQSIYKKRFSSDTLFYTSLCQEPFFQDCRLYRSDSNVKNTATVQSAQSAKISMEQMLASFECFGNEKSTNTRSQSKSLPKKSKKVAALLAIFLGGWGIHKFYLKKNLLGVIYLLLCWTYVPAIIGFIEGIMILSYSDAKFQQKYNCRTS